MQMSVHYSVLKCIFQFKNVKQQQNYGSYRKKQ